MIKFVRKKVYRTEWAEWLLYKNEIFREVLESAYEVIAIYNNGTYYGYIDMELPLRVMVPEHEPEYEPRELAFSDDIIEEAYIQLKNCRHLRLIPLNLPYKDDVMVFICNEPIVEVSAPYEQALCALDTYAANGRTQKLFIEKFLNHKEGFVLSELNEFTFRCYKILKKENVRIWCEGYLWKLVGIDTDNMKLVSEERITYVTPRDVCEIAKLVNSQECVYAANVLHSKGIEAYTVLVPALKDIEKLSILEEIMNKQLFNFPRIIENHETELERFFYRKFLEIEDDKESVEIPKQELVHPEIIGDGEATIYLVGACIVEGTVCQESASLANILYQKCVERFGKYKICRVVVQNVRMDIQRVVEELDIMEEDRIFFFCTSYDRSITERCIDMLPVYNARKQEELFFTDYPLHTLRRGNEAIAECLLSCIDKSKRSDGNKNYLQVGRPRVSIEEKNELMAYTAKIKVNLRTGERGVGAVVMNANPFTLGHLYLIEKAVKQVDLLYLFVVQENLSEFQFEDRFRLVKEGTSHLKNVIVVPSGRFVLSRRTMSAYFEKETLQESWIDASKDVAIFGSYIAPELSIDVRFVGEEPFDSVTRQYNEEMKKKLPLYGVKVTEISRTDVEGVVISASTVRGLYQEQKWEEIEKMVPKTTFQFLKCRPVMRDKRTIVVEVPESLAEIKKLFIIHDKVVLYPAGQDGKKKFKMLSKAEQDKVCFADIKALHSSYIFCGKPVLSPRELCGTMKDAPVVITSARYQAEICRYLMDLGINLDRMYLL